MLVAGKPQLEIVPSQHFGAVLCMASEPFRSVIAALIDGERVDPGGDPRDIMELESTSGYALLAGVDLSPGVDLCFVIKVWARTDARRYGRWDPRHKPKLLDDVCASGGVWELYNCEVDVRAWGVKRLFDGDYPRG